MKLIPYGDTLLVKKLKKKDFEKIGDIITKTETSDVMHAEIVSTSDTAEIKHPFKKGYIVYYPRSAPLNIDDQKGLAMVRIISVIAYEKK